MAERRVLGSVRARVTLATTATVALVLVIAGVGLVARQRSELTANLDRTLVVRADELAGEAEAGRLPDNPGAPASDDPGLVQVVDEDGAVVSASTNLTGQPPVAASPGSNERIRTVEELPLDDDSFRLLSRQVDGPDGRFVIHVAVSADPIDESVQALRTSLLVGIPLLLLVIALITWASVGRALRPIEAIRLEVEELSPEDTAQRVDVPPGGDEVARLAETMNAMLARIDESVSRQRRFVADASHELRSPLTRLRAELEIDLAHPDHADPWETHRRLLRSLDQLQRLSDDLLDLAQAGGGAPRRLLDLDDVVLETVRAIHAPPGIVIDASGVSGAQVVVDPGALGRVVVNLLDNAVRHARSKVRVELGEQDPSVVLVVADDGEGVAVADRERIFERFVRLDDARSADGGRGLGLAIAREVVERHGGRISVHDAEGGGARFEVVLPAPPSSDGELD